MRRTVEALLCALLGVVQVAPAGEPLRKGAPAPPLKIARLLNAPPGAKADWAALQGKWVVLEFWATWCGPCVAAVPHLNTLMDQYKDRPVVLIAITKEKPETVKKFIAQRPIHGWVAIDDGGATFEAYGVRSIPTTIIVDPQGRLVAYSGPRKLTKAVMDDLLAGRDPQLWWYVPPAAAKPDRQQDKPLPAPVAGVLIRPADGETVEYGQAIGKWWYRNLPLRELIARLWEVRETRIEIRDPIAPDPLSIEIHLKGGSPQEGRELAREVLPRLRNVRVRQVQRRVEAYRLTVLPEARSRLEAAALGEGAGALYSSWSSGGSAEFVSAPMEHIARVLERILKRPVVDATGLDGHFDLKFEWTPGDPESLRQALRKLGLDLVPTRKAVPFIVVEQAPGRVLTRP